MLINVWSVNEIVKELIQRLFAGGGAGLFLRFPTLPRQGTNLWGDSSLDLLPPRCDCSFASPLEPQTKHIGFQLELVLPVLGVDFLGQRLVKLTTHSSEAEKNC